MSVAEPAGRRCAVAALTRPEYRPILKNDSAWFPMR